MKRIAGIIMIVIGSILIAANIKNISSLGQISTNQEKGYISGYLIGIVVQLTVAIILLFFGIKIRKK